MTATFDETQTRERFVRDLYAGKATRPAFMCIPQFIEIENEKPGRYTLSERPLNDWLPWIIEKHEKWSAFHERVGDDGIACADIMTPTHIYAAAFGCPVHDFENSNPAAMPLVNNAGEADQLTQPSIENSPTLVRILELAELVQERLGKETPLSAVDYQSGYDIAAQIWEKSDFMCAMVMDPHAVKRLSAKCAAMLKEFYTVLRQRFPQMNPCHCPGSWTPPELGPWLSNDECGAMSKAMFEEFCLPELIDLSETFGGLGMHCCADAEHQFPSFNKIPNFYGFNRVPAKRGFEPILEHFGGPDAPVHVLSWVAEEQIKMLIANAAPGTRFIFNKIVESEDDAKRWLETMHALA